MDNPEELAQKMAQSRVKDLELPKETPEEKKSKTTLVITLSFVGLTLVAGALALYFLVLKPSATPKETSTVQEPETSTVAPTDPDDDTPKIYSRLSGEEISSEEANSHPTYCVQIPNGIDGARPQVGLQDAKVIFEAIAEAGITRFAAIYQDPPAVIGPIRSLRLYYLNWDVPFDCTVVHAGGSNEALSAIKSYGTRDLSENYAFMWRSSANYTVQRLWNNLFTSNEYLNGHSTLNGYLSSDVKAFARFTPAEAARNKIDVQVESKLKIDQPTDKDTDALTPRVTHLVLRFGAIPNFNPVYDYDPTTNTYKRSYETGAAHLSYDCSGKTGDITPELVCTEVQLAPSVVIAMFVQEKKATYDNYHEDISTIGAGDAYVFQNGTAIQGTWEKSSKDAQIIFKDTAGNVIPFVPGQVWIHALPVSYGASVQY